MTSSCSDNRSSWNPDVGVHHGDELVAGAIACDVEGGHHDAEVVLEPLLWTEGQRAHPGVQAVGSHHEVEVPPRPAAECHVHVVAGVIDGLHRVAENGLDAPLGRPVDGRRQVGAGDGHVAIPRPHERGRLERGDPPPVTTDRPRLQEVVAAAPQLGDDAHPLGDVEASTPEVHHVAPAAQLGRALDQRRLMPEALQPVGQRGTGDPRTDDQHPHVPAIRIRVRLMVRPPVYAPMRLHRAPAHLRAGLLTAAGAHRRRAVPGPGCRYER